MKKLFFFKSSASSSGSNNAAPPKSTNKQMAWDNFSDSGMNNQGQDYFQGSKGLFSKSRKQVFDSQSSCGGPGLRRSRSLSSSSHQFKDPTRSPSSSIASDPYHQFEHSSRCQALNFEKQKRDKPTQFAASSVQNSHRYERPGSTSSSRSHHESSGNSSTCSSNISSKIVDRYIDGEQQPEESRARNNSQRNSTRHGNYGMKLPPKVQHTAPNSPTHGVKDKPRAHSFREPKVTRLRLSSRDWTEDVPGQESPRSLAKNVIERLSQSCDLAKTSSKDFNFDNPITIEDIYARSVNGHYDSDFDDALPKVDLLDESCRMTNGYHGMDGDCEGVSCDEPEEDAELMRRSKEAEERVILFSKKLERENFFPDSGYDLPSLVQTIRNLLEEKTSLALEVSTHLRSRIADRKSAKEELRCVKTELEFRTRRLEKEKNEMQSALEKELDRRSSDWSFKLEKYQLEEQRLRERVRELAEQNVSLQREVSSFSEREMESKSLMAYSDQQLKGLTDMTEKMKQEIMDLQQNLLELQEKCKLAEENRDCILRNFEEKETECKELHKSLARLLRTCSEQEKTITGLQDGFSDNLHKNQPMESVDKHIAKMQMEQMRLTEVELTLRRELESSRFEADSLRHENIILLNRLKGDGKECVAATYRLDKELWARIYCLQNQGLTMLNESTYLCSKLLELVKGKGGHLRRNVHLDLEVIGSGLDGQFIVESETKIQGLKNGTEGLTRSLQMMSSLLKEKSNPLTSKFQSECIDVDKLAKLNDLSSEDIIRTELKAECLVTSLLREKLYSKELQVEHMQAELATAVRGNDILRSEVQNALDNLSSSTHKLKDLELQMLKKDNSINCLQSDLQEANRELSSTKGNLSRVLEERDIMGKQVKQFKEQNMLLNAEVNVLKTKIETLDVHILEKEGQIDILRDALGENSFDLLGSSDSMHEFLA
ncbi:paramyosin [Abrus precatorius]|uniref:Paramyosin n=1 Tax=Abrus precatorius TaxID=3816 RepID=A0A8B8M9W6_ABRPR|nr:paramyosin [Abrus precatorius]XP_027365482.1 paramyosin [Abrus precatorius]XP_027365483.1 paramyosin [Abrus precatorius]